MAKLVKADNGWLVILWDPKPPEPPVPGQPPCAQPATWWSTFVFLELGEAMTFLGEYLEAHDART